MVIYIYFFFSVCRFIIIIFAICNSCLIFLSFFLAIVYNCICIDVFVDLLLMLVNLPIINMYIKLLIKKCTFIFI